MDDSEACPSTPKSVRLIKNPFSGSSSEHEHFPRFSPSVFRVDGTPIGCRFQWTVDQIALLNPAEIEEEKYMAAQEIKPVVDMQVQQELDDFFAKGQNVSSPWIPPESKGTKHVTFSPFPPAYISMHEETMEEEEEEDEEENDVENEAMTADNIQNMSFSTLKRKLFDEEEEKAMSYAQTEAESPIKIHYAEVPLTPPTPESESKRTFDGVLFSVPLEASPVLHVRRNLDLSPILSADEKTTRKLTFDDDEEEENSEDDDIETMTIMSTPEKNDVRDRLDNTPNRWKYDGVREYPVRRLSNALLSPPPPPKLKSRFNVDMVINSDCSSQEDECAQSMSIVCNQTIEGKENLECAVAGSSLAGVWLGLQGENEVLGQSSVHNTFMCLSNDM